MNRNQLVSDGANEAPGSTFVLVEEHGRMCVIPLEGYLENRYAVEAGYWVAARDNIALADIEWADGDLRAELELCVRQLLDAHGFDWDKFRTWDPALVWQNLKEQAEVEAEQMPEGWTPLPEDFSKLRVEVGDSFYESSGFRAGGWEAKVPRSVRERFAVADAGMFGEYFGFDWEDEQEVVTALEALGHSVIREHDVGD